LRTGRLAPALVVAASCVAGHPTPEAPPASVWVATAAAPGDASSEGGASKSDPRPVYIVEEPPPADGGAPLDHDSPRVTRPGAHGAKIPAIPWCDSLPRSAVQCGAADGREALRAALAADRARLARASDIRQTLVRARTVETSAALLRETDADLAALEACTDLPPGFARALRAWMTPDCADTLADPVLRKQKPGTASREIDLLRGLAAASKLRRWSPPPFPRVTATEVAAVTAFLQRAVPKWLESLAELRALEPTRVTGSYGSFAARVAWADAWEGVVRAGFRPGLDLPFKGDPELRSAFYDVVDPLLSEARTAAETARRVARAMGAQLGVLDDPRLGDSPMDGKPRTWGLEFVGVPLVERNDTSTLASELPTAFAAELLPAETLEPSTWTSLLARGAPFELRVATSAWLALHTDDPRAPALHLALARAHVRLGLLYQTRSSFERALIELAYASATDETTLLAALSRAMPMEGDTAHLARGVQVDSAPLERVTEQGSSAAIRTMATMDLRLLQVRCTTDKEESMRLTFMLRDGEYGSPWSECLRDQFDPPLPKFLTFPPPLPPGVRCPWPWRGH
jgi:hypothetical protein